MKKIGNWRISSKIGIGMKNLTNLPKSLICIFFSLSTILMNKAFPRRRCESIRIIAGVSEFLNASMVRKMNFRLMPYLMALIPRTNMSLGEK